MADIGGDLRKIIQMPTKELAKILKISKEAAKLIQTLISDFFKE